MTNKTSNLYSVHLHSDLTNAGTSWCNRNLNYNDWYFKYHPIILVSVFTFLSQLHAQQFENEFSDWIKK
jgi:hypothetical protein